MFTLKHQLLKQLADSDFIAVILGGDQPASAPAKALLAGAKMVIAADSGGDIALALGVCPQALLGDMDSVSAVTLEACRQNQSKILTYPPEKNFTDGELALEFATQNLTASKRILIFGAFGNRLDHTLANLLMGLPLAQNGIEVLYYQEGFLACLLHHSGAALGGRAMKTIWGESGDTLSLLPLSKQAIGITLKGFYYPLVDATIHQGQSIGISNILTTVPGQIFLTEGSLLIVHNF